MKPGSEAGRHESGNGNGEKAMNTTPDFELLKEAYAIIDGIPEAAISLGLPCTKAGAALDEGTVCSPEGWLALHPRFRQLGLRIGPDGKDLRFSDEPGFWPTTVEPLARVFGLSAFTAGLLFGDRILFTGGDDSGLSDKQLWQGRLREYLRQEGQLDRPSDSEPAPDTAGQEAQGTDVESDERRPVKSLSLGERHSAESTRGDRSASANT
jgi:hypothetical protein